MCRGEIMELLAISFFSITILLCVFLKLPIALALVIGYIIFSLYGLKKGISLKLIIMNSFESVKQVGNILIVFILIGIITAMWRASGTIAGIITIGSQFINPNVFILLSFILNAVISILLGTSLGTSATMGVICISIARTLGINEVYTAAAVVSGIYVGDRCSPMSTSAILIATITKTDLFKNLKLMIKTTIVPIIITCIIYYLMGLGNSVEVTDLDVTKIYRENYNLNFIVITPAILIIALSLFKIDVKRIMLSSIILSFIIAIIFQKREISELIKFAIVGFVSEDSSLNEILAGGGIISMIKAMIIVTVSCSYAGIFATTHMLDKLKSKILLLSNFATPFGSIIITALVTAIITCNQSLCSILTNQLTEDVLDNQKRAIALENTCIVMAPLVPWNIAGAIPLANMGVGIEAIPFMFYLMLVPLWNFITQFINKDKHSA